MSLKVRQTSRTIGNLERRVTLGLADEIAQSRVVVGIAGDYKERPILNEEGQIKDQGTYYEMRGGIIYNFNSALRFGARTGGHFDKSLNKEYAVGIGGLLGENFIFNGDLIFEEENPSKATAGLGILFNKFFDLRGSYGYHLNDKRQEGAAGIFLVATKVSIFYIANLPEIGGPVLEHQAGLRLNMAF